MKRLHFCVCRPLFAAKVAVPSPESSPVVDIAPSWILGFALMGLVGKILLNLGIGGVLLTGGYFAYRHGQRKELSLHASEEAARVLLPLAKCIAENPLLPPSAPALPKTLAALEGGYTPTSTELAHPAYRCAPEAFSQPLHLQVRWRKESDQRGAILASFDANGDGRSDEWFESPVVCHHGSCTASRFTFEVTEDGARTPPISADLQGAPGSYQSVPPRVIEGEPAANVAVNVPSKAANGKVSGAPASSAEPQEKNELPDVALEGQPLSLAMLQGQMEKRVREKVSGAALVDYLVVGSTDDTIDPSAGESLKMTFGVPSSGLVVGRGTDLVSVTYGAGGLKWTTMKADAALQSETPACSASQIIATHQPEVLSFSPGMGTRPSAWVLNFTKPKKRTVVVNPENCAVTRAR